MSSNLLTRGGRFAATGLISTGIHVLVAAAFVNLIAPMPAIANGCAFIVATVFSYLANTLWSFSTRLHGRNLLRFVTVAVAGCLLAMAISGTAEMLGWHYLVGIALVVCILPPVTFVAHNRWTYR
jgi:putative flippase GtrA